MGFNFRGSKKANFSTENQHGFQEKSAPGPRRGVGGDQPYAADAAKKRFSKPLSIKVSTNPITQRAKPSPLKMNEALVAGARDTGKKFVDAGAEVGKAFKTKDKKPKSVNLGSKDGDAPKESDFKILANKAANSPTMDVDKEVGKLKANATEQTSAMFGGGFANSTGFQTASDNRFDNMFKQ
tara:strand:+ start:3108 stop:3653 length:546 start_codon:yes stop_codon:yes gene_type:complete